MAPASLPQVLSSGEVRRIEFAREDKNLDRKHRWNDFDQKGRSRSDERVTTWENLLGLSEGQQQALQTLVQSWTGADLDRPPSLQTWLVREAEVRAALSAEQADLLHRANAVEIRKRWSQMGYALGGLLGASKDDHGRYQHTLGDQLIPERMILPEAHGADNLSLLSEAIKRLQGVLSPDQVTRLKALTGCR